jgi:hypothetical protein
MGDAGKEEVRALSALIRRPVRVGMYETVLNVWMDDDKASMRTECYDVVETHRELRINRRGIRLYGWTRPKGDFIATLGRWDCQGYMTRWEDDFTPVIMHKVGKIFTFSEWREQVTFERDCHRPGASRFPVDSYQRVLDGDDYGAGTYNPPKMQNHWPMGVPR